MKALRLSTVVALLSTSMLAGAQARPSPTPASIYDRSKDSVVMIITFDSKKAPLSQGSGFIASKNRIVTNYHVIAGSSFASIVFNDGTTVVGGDVIAASVPKDLVILEVNTGRRAPLGLGDELNVKVGSPVYAIGSPNGLSSSLSSGLVSAFREDDGQFLIQITASIAPGSSGGPLFDSQGKVIGITTSKLNDGSFGFAVGAGDIAHLLKTPLSIPVDLASLEGDSNPREASSLTDVRKLYDADKYQDARQAFSALPEEVKKSYDGTFLLCKIQADTSPTDTAACDAALTLKPEDGAPYGVKAYAAFVNHNLSMAEGFAERGIQLSQDSDSKQMMALSLYYEARYAEIPKYVSEETDDVAILSLLQGVARRTGDTNAYNRTTDKLRKLGVSPTYWELFDEGYNSEKNLKFDDALASYKKCAATKNAWDPICSIAVARLEAMNGDLPKANEEITKALNVHFGNTDVIYEALFVSLLRNDRVAAADYHQKLQDASYRYMDSTDCLYFYSIDEPSQAQDHCARELSGGTATNHTVWSNAGYVALDVGRYQDAYSDFAKAVEIYLKETSKHTVTQEVDLTWGLMLAEYFSGHVKEAKETYAGFKKDYPDFVSITTLKQLPLIWSTQTQALMGKMQHDLP